MKNERNIIVNGNVKPYHVVSKNLFNSPTTTLNSKLKANLTKSTGNQVFTKLIATNRLKENNASPFQHRLSVEEDMRGTNKLKSNFNIGEVTNSKTKNFHSKFFFIFRAIQKCCGVEQF